MRSFWIFAGSCFLIALAISVAFGWIEKRADNKKAWRVDCARWRGTLLRGKFAHWCHSWDGLPVDETTPEFACCECQWTPWWQRRAFKAALAAAKQTEATHG